MGSQVNSIKYLSEKLYQLSTISFREQEQGEYFLTHFLRPKNVTLISNPDKDITRKENYRPLSVINTDATSSTNYKEMESNNA